MSLSEKVSANLADMKAKLEDKSPKGYTKESIAAAIASGTVDSSLLRETMDFKGGEVYSKLAIKMYNDMAAKTAEMASYPEADFSKFEGKVQASTLAEIKAAYDAAMADSAAQEASYLAGIEEKKKAALADISVALKVAAEEEKRAEAGLLECISQMEKLKVDIEGLQSVTVGEILEREPELRAEIEEELKNNVWAP